MGRREGRKEIPREEGRNRVSEGGREAGKGGRERMEGGRH